ncbi:glycosyltransferase family 4 protein [Thalassobacterium sedimentorum]|nr:glycosyltransferase family 4 protein [Coraliomargarita sp. SDUM461004]
MAEPLIARGHRVYIVIEDTADNRARLLLECPNAIPLFCERLDRRADRIQRRDLASSVDPDVVWICGLGIRNWVKFRHGRHRPICMMDHVELFSGIKRQGGLRALWDAAVEWGALLSFDAHICASRYLDKLFARRLDLLLQKKPTFYFPYAYGEQMGTVDSGLLSQLSQRYSGKKVLLYMGSFYENYGCFDMLDAVRQLALIRDDFIFLMMGGGPLKTECQGLVEQIDLKGRAEVLGYIPEEELSTWFSLANGFICPLRDTVQDWARCPSKLYMYLPFGKPIVTSPIGEAKDLLKEDGFFYPPGDIDQLSQAMGKVLDLENWEPRSDASLHNWNQRADEWLTWVETTYPHLKRSVCVQT